MIAPLGSQPFVNPDPAQSAHHGAQPQKPMSAICTVDAELFDSLQEAIEFVATRGGGIVYTQMANTLFAKSLELPNNVCLKLSRAAAA